MVTPRLYQRINVSVSYHAHISKLIRTLEPLLSINQRKQLRKEGQYRGQQESFSNLFDPQEKPRFGEYVRQATLFIGDPGKNHKFIVNRYVEEALKNMTSLEIVETSSITEYAKFPLLGFPRLTCFQIDFQESSKPKESQGIKCIGW
jgi:hypothetical protein